MKVIWSRHWLTLVALSPHTAPPDHVAHFRRTKTLAVLLSILSRFLWELNYFIKTLTLSGEGGGSAAQTSRDWDESGGHRGGCCLGSQQHYVTAYKTNTCVGSSPRMQTRNVGLKYVAFAQYFVPGSPVSRTLRDTILITQSYLTDCKIAFSPCEHFLNDSEHQCFLLLSGTRSQTDFSLNYIQHGKLGLPEGQSEHRTGSSPPVVVHKSVVSRRGRFGNLQVDKIVKTNLWLFWSVNLHLALNLKIFIEQF